MPLVNQVLEYRKLAIHARALKYYTDPLPDFLSLYGFKI
jgi:hypothetical protein